MLTGARLGVLLSGDSTKAQIDTGGGAGYDETVFEAYNSHFYQFDLYRKPLFRRPQVGVVHSDEYLPRGDLRQTEYYNEFLVPFGLECTTIATFTAAPSRLEVFSLVASRRSDELVAESTSLIEALLPHLRTACGLRRILAEQRARNAQKARSSDWPSRPSCWIPPARYVTRTALRPRSCAANKGLASATAG
ncbi:MAG TPA: hypothetical protein VHX52_06200 [Steroidobacteraceae bacterium]|jgi:hypothetical protein|nr:hypothetical protein [Steroidobacteraceae bacterium]